MIERTNQIHRIYGMETVVHTYKTRVDPQTMKATYEHLVSRVYDRQAQVHETDFRHRVDVRA